MSEQGQETAQRRDRFPRRLRLVHNGDVYVVVAWYRRFWPNGDSCWVDLAGGDTRRSAIRRAARELIAP